MKIITLPVSDLHPADYNPRKDLAPGDKQYDKLARSIETFGYVEPIVWNRTTGNIVGGHQRLKVLVEQGYKTVEVVEVELNEQEERILNVSLNKISGRWDNEKLTAILDELKEQDEMALTGFEDWELDALKVTYDHIEDLLNEDFSDTGKSEPTSYTMTFTLPEVFHDVMKNIPRIAEAGAYGVIVEGMKFFKAKPGMTKIGGDFCYPLPRLRHDFEAIKAECHRYGLKFYSGENRLRAMGDSMTCCGIDGLPGFRPNEYNLCMLMNGKNPEPTEKMKEVGTGGPFKTLNQSAGSGRKIAKQSFYGLMQEELAKKTDYHRKVFGLDE